MENIESFSHLGSHKSVNKRRRIQSSKQGMLKNALNDGSYEDRLLNEANSDLNQNKVLRVHRNRSDLEYDATKRQWTSMKNLFGGARSQNGDHMYTRSDNN